MTVAITGEIYQDLVADDTGSGRFTIPNVTVPADADIAIVISCGYDIEGFTELNWNGDVSDVDFIELITADGGGDMHVWATYMLVTDGAFPTDHGVEANTLYWSWFDDCNYGSGATCLFFLSGVDTDDTIVGTDDEETNTDNWTSNDLGTGADDMAIIAGCNYGDIVADGVDGQTEIWDHSAAGNVDWGMAYEIAETTPEVACASATFFGGVAFAIKASEDDGGEPLIINVFDGFNMVQTLD